MLALAEPLPDRVTAGWNQLLCTALSGARSAHRRALASRSRSSCAAARGRCKGPTASTRSASRARPGHALAGHGDVRALDAALHGVLRVPARLRRRRPVARRLGTQSRWRFYGEGELGVAIGDDGAREGAEPAAGAVRRRAGGLNTSAALPRRHVRDWGSKESCTRIPDGHDLRGAQRRRRRLRATRTRDAATRARRGARRACCRREGARELRRRGAARRSRASTRPRRRAAAAGGAHELPARHRRRRDVHRLPVLWRRRPARAQDELDARRPVGRPRDRAGEIAARSSAWTSATFIAAIELIVHGTTVSTNAVLTGNGARTGAARRPRASATRCAARRQRESRTTTACSRRGRSSRATAPRRRRARRPERREEVHAARRGRRARRREALRAARASRPSRSRSCTRRPTPAHERARWRPLPRVAARGLRDRVERSAAAGALLRPHVHDRAERLCRADHHPLPLRPHRAPRRASASAACC